MSSVEKIDSPAKFSILLRTLEILKQLRDKNLPSLINTQELLDLGYSRAFFAELTQDSYLLHTTIQNIEARITEWRQTYRQDINALVEYRPDILLDLRSGIYSLLGQIYLMDPSNVEKIERELKLPVTGDAKLLMANWNRTYYGTRCLAFDEPLNCLIKAARHNDINTFTKLFPEYQYELHNSEIVEMMEQTSNYEIFSQLFSVYKSFRHPELDGYDYVKAQAGRPDTLPILQLIFSQNNLVKTMPLALHAAAKAGNRTNFAFLAKIAIPSEINLFNIAGGAFANDWFDIAKPALLELKKIQPDKFSEYLERIKQGL